MTIQIKPWLIFTILIGVLIIVFSMIRGCQQNKTSLAAATRWKQKTDSVSKAAIQVKKEKDSTIQLYKDTLDFVNGQLALRENQLTTRILQLDSADKRITNLINKHKYIQPSADTSSTYVPNEFVDNCNQCFTELSNGQQKVKEYMAQIDNLNQTYQSKINVQENKIDFLNKKADQYAEMLQNCISDSKKAESTLTPKSALYLTWGVLWQPWPKGAGAGISYQNKYKVQFGAKYYWTTYGNMVETQMSLPLSLKLF